MMERCACCGKEGEYGSLFINAVSYKICPDCSRKIALFRNGLLDADDLLSEETIPELAAALSEEATEKPEEKTEQSVKSGVGTLITVISTIVFSLSVIGAFIAMSTYGFAVGAGIILVCTLLYMLCLGISVICHRLTSIDSKLK